MKLWLFIVAVFVTVFTPFIVYAEPPSPAQTMELQKLSDNGAVTAADFEKFLGAHLPIADKTPATPLVATVESTHKVSVDCDLKRAIKTGKYDWVSDTINTDNFPEENCKTGQAEVYVVRPSSETTTGEVLDQLARIGLRPATLLELLALGTARNNIQGELLIMAHGSSWRFLNGVVFPILEWHSRRKWVVSLRCSDPGSVGLKGFRFAAVRK